MGWDQKLPKTNLWGITLEYVGHISGTNLYTLYINIVNPRLSDLPWIIPQIMCLKLWYGCSAVQQMDMAFFCRRIPAVEVLSQRDSEIDPLWLEVDLR